MKCIQIYVFVINLNSYTVPAIWNVCHFFWAGLFIPQALILFVSWFVFCVFSGFLQLVSWLQLAHQWGPFLLPLSIKQFSTPLWQEMNGVWAHCVNVSHLTMQYTSFSTLLDKHTHSSCDITFVLKTQIVYWAQRSLFSLFCDAEQRYFCVDVFCLKAADEHEYYFIFSKKC